MTIIPRAEAVPPHITMADLAAGQFGQLKPGLVKRGVAALQSLLARDPQHGDYSYRPFVPSKGLLHLDELDQEWKGMTRTHRPTGEEITEELCFSSKGGCFSARKVIAFPERNWHSTTGGCASEQRTQLTQVTGRGDRNGTEDPHCC